MRAQVGRHLQQFDLDEVAVKEEGMLAAAKAALHRDLSEEDLPPEFNWREYASLLLDVAAEIEHSLMVQYLFTAYTLGGPQVPAGLRQKVREWQELILDVAKEEMGHLITMQNVRTALGLPLHLDREEYPWKTRFYPYGFRLQPLTLQSVAMYVCAESPADWKGKEAEEIRELAAEGAKGVVTRVGELYKVIEEIFSGPERIPDTAIDASTLPRQSSWDEWGRGYSGAGLADSGNVPGVRNPDVLVVEVSSRDTLLHAVKEIGEQGEGPTQPPEGEVSHFERFLGVYRELKQLSPEEQQLIARPVEDEPSTGPTSAMSQDPVACAWAHLFNLRYRMLLVNLSHAYQIPDLPEEGVNTRGALINRTFAEMYNLRAIASRLVELTLPGPEHISAAPPFEMPYTLELPPSERHRWILHRNLLEASGKLIEELIERESPGREYLFALAEADRIAFAQVERMLGAVTGSRS
jgi:hypothetical protein